MVLTPVTDGRIGAVIGTVCQQDLRSMGFG